MLSACAVESPPQNIETIATTTTDTVHPATIAANKASVSAIGFTDRRDFERAEKGFIATFDDGTLAYDPTSYDFVMGDAPDTVNTSLWRQSKLLAKHGLLKVTDGIYQVHSFDLSNITFIQGKTGWNAIANRFFTHQIAPLVSSETLDKINMTAQTLRYKQGAAIELRGQAVNHFYLIKQGMMQLGVNRRDRSQFNLVRLNAGHSFGERAFFLGGTAVFDVRAETDVILLKLSRPVIDRLMTESLDFSKAVTMVAYKRLARTLSHIGDVQKLPLDARLAKQILTISKSCQNADVTRVRHIDLAHALAVTRVSIGKTIKELSDKSLIDIGYGKLEILSRQGLTTLATLGKKNRNDS